MRCKARKDPHGKHRQRHYTDAAQADITFLKNNVKLVAHTEPRDQLLSVPVVRVRRTASSGFEADESFVP
ncbi:type VI secretion system baseplate subunit TssK, partial [Burkholderia sp. SIMBA_019]